MENVIFELYKSLVKKLTMEKLEFGSIITADLQENTITFEMDNPISVRGGEYAIIRIDSLEDKIKIETMFKND